MRVDERSTDSQKSQNKIQQHKISARGSEGESSFGSLTPAQVKPGQKGMRELESFARPSRVIVDRVKPEIDGGRFPAKRFIDAPVEISAILLIDGHDHLKGRLLYRHETESRFRAIPMTSKGNDEWLASFQPKELGRYIVTVEAAIDRFDTWRSDIKKKLGAGQNVEVDLRTGVLLFEGVLNELGVSEKRLAEEKIKQMNAWIRAKANPDVNELTVLIDDPALEKALDPIYDADSITRYSRELPIQVEPKLARFSAWYEFFPRSASNEPGRHGTFRDAQARLDYVKQMGFDIVYFPPIHPIGVAFRKGRNNSLTPEANDVGSPWAIGGKEGGHKAFHPSLGTIADFERLIARARQLEIEIALDIAFQCSPDHPYVKEHPEWFKKRPDGTIQYAENPPKKYQDIYPFDFETPAWASLWKELLSVVKFWVDRGVRVFRVDNPHTKSLHFWEWCIREIRSEHPEVIFLSEAFTRPHLMAYLAKAGFSQSYTYFSWRNAKWELEQYLTELTKTELIDFFGANFWPNTPDILPEPLQTNNRAIYMQRLILAATLSSSYGIYGPAFELMEYKPRNEGSEEYLDSEKYQLRHWDLNKQGTLAPLIERINEIRKTNLPLQANRTLQFHPVSNDMILAFSKSHTLPDGEIERILVVVNLDPHHVQSGMVELPLFDWEIDPSETFQVHDLLTDARYFWTGWRNYVELNPHSLPAHIFSVRKRTRKAQDFDYFT